MLIKLKKITPVALKPIKLGFIFLIICALLGFAAGKLSKKLNQFTISDHQIQAISDYAFQIIDSHFYGGNKPEVNLPKIPKYEKLFVTFLHNNRVRCSQGVGDRASVQDRTASDIEQAVVSCIQDERFGGAIQQQEISDIQITLNYFYNKRKISSDFSTQQRLIQLGIHAIEIAKAGESTFYKESVAICQVPDLLNTLSKKRCLN